eukprot:TRINITY_DN63833_c0_g1_i1.p1 TRINITY_DN63833_c0_g1~~TRINITY_DN63833_c0_g1_i1.p1  ORF type:complete len:393 (+),score=87.83 TRINITY_DN63833_c0_g1_i1:113-1291(+)
MPVYEEKLISPLALRYTQEHIRTTFRDGRVVEESLREIRAEPCTSSDSYDLVLRAPFPTIEIVRFRPPSAGERVSHWFTLDNRRLYCLQRAAVELWPKRVAVVVDMLYADSGHVWKKYDTTTCGMSVTIATSCKRAPICRWDWRQERKQTVSPALAAGAMRSVEADDTKERVDDLEGTVGAEEQSAVMRLMLALGTNKCTAGATSAAVRSSTPSTATDAEGSSDADDSTSRSVYSGVGGFPQAIARRPAEPLTPGLQQQRSQGDYNSASTRALQEIRRQVRHPKFDGRLKLHQWSQRYGSSLGSLRQFLEKHPEEFTVTSAGAGQFLVAAATASAAGGIGARDEGAKAKAGAGGARRSNGKNDMGRGSRNTRAPKPVVEVREALKPGLVVVH